MTYYIVTNKKDNVADSGIIPCGIGDHDLVYVIRHARLPKIKKDPKIVTVRSTKNLTLSGPGGGSEARMTKLTADNQKPLTL